MLNALAERVAGDHERDAHGGLRTRLSDHGDVLDVRGELDMASVPQFDAAIRLLMSTARTKLVVNLSAVTFIDSSGLGALLRAHRISRDHGVAFVLQDPSDRVRSLLALTALDATLRVEMQTPSS
ncbi:MAG TPA: STAS domain-containing protein [Acidimicrobiia bacterium]|jgi:anti-sigma B factor antagonist